jgi:Collagen triple helix repeat (20 copies)
MGFWCRLLNKFTRYFMCSGDCCCTGPQGPQGIQGFQGPQGPQGVPGLSGSTGSIGPMGPIGPVGSQGPQGLTGPVGAQGLQGTAGQDGKPGAVGPVGPVGPLGPQGVQGLQGPAGKDCDCTDANGPYANVFATVAQTVQPYNVPAINDQVLFDSQNAVSATTDFDLSQMNITGDVKFLRHGIYHIAWQLQARIAVLVQPVPSWSFGFWVNGILVPGSIYSGYTSSPNDDAAHSTGDVIIEVQANSLLRLRNTCLSAVQLNPNISGSVFPITIASINIECLKILP